jgi:hypothetical protein
MRAKGLPVFLELVAGEVVGFVDGDHDAASPLGGFRVEGVGGLGDERRFVEAGDVPEPGDDGHVDASCADRGVAQVDDGVARGVEIAEGGAHGDGFAGADFSGDHPDGGFVDAPGDPGDSFGVAGVAVQHGGGQVFAERGAGESPMGAQAADAAHRAVSSTLSLPTLSA